MQFSDMCFVSSKQDLLYRRGLMDAIEANVDVIAKDPELKCGFFDKPFTGMYLMRGGTHRAQALELEVCHGWLCATPYSLSGTI